MIRHNASKPKSKEELYREYLEARIEELESRERQRNPNFRPPEPPERLKKLLQRKPQ